MKDAKPAAPDKIALLIFCALPGCIGNVAPHLSGLVRLSARYSDSVKKKWNPAAAVEG